MTAHSRRQPSSWEDATLTPLWLDCPDRPEARPPLVGTFDVDLVVVGGGFTGLWSALRALERDPATSVMVLESARIAGEATGRNGGFCSSSLTHGEANGRRRWPGEFETLQKLGADNLDGIEQTIARYAIDCGFVRSRHLYVATSDHQAAGLDTSSAAYLDAARTRRILDSPTYKASYHTDDGQESLVDPARLAWGLARAAETLGAAIAENTEVQRVRRSRDRMEITTGQGTVTAARVILATNAFPNPLRRLRWWTVPVYDYVLATEPLTDAQLAATGWTHDLGVSDAGNQFHYYRLTPDRRILWGGYDAVYHFGRSIQDQHIDRAETYAKLARHFEETFPQLAGIRFTHRWAGVIDTSTRFSAFFGTAHNGRLAYAAGFTGLGVGASRFAADTMLDLLDGQDTKRTGLDMVRRRGVPFPPEPFAWPAIRATQIALAREDRTGRRGLWLRLLDRLGLGFDS